MAIDFGIQYDCVPRRELGDEQILDLLKEQERAELIIQMFRQNNDPRPPSEMGFEFTRTTPEGEQETQLIVVQDALDRAEELKVRSHHCKACPANRIGKPFGCYGFIQYPLSGAAEAWLLEQLPGNREALLWLLLKQGIDNFMYDGQAIAVLRQKTETYFQDRKAAMRRLGEYDINANQVFEMIFGVGDISPNHAGILLLFFNVIERDIQADEVMSIGDADPVAFPYLMQVNERFDDQTIRELKGFFHALHTAWRLRVPLYISP
jgi:hypothetical protein